MIKRYIVLIIHIEKWKQLPMKVTLVMYSNQSIVLLYQTKKSLGQCSGWIID